MRAEVDASSAAVPPENAAALAAGKTSTSCVANVVKRPSFLLDEKDDVSSTTNDDDTDYKLLYFRSEMLRTEALLKGFWTEEANRKLRIELIQKDVELYEQQYKTKRLLQSQSESSTLAPASTSASSSQTEPVVTIMTSQETQTKIFEEEHDGMSDNSPSAARTEENEEEVDVALEKDELLEGPSTVEICDAVDKSPTTNNTGMDIDVGLGENKADAKVGIGNELTGDGQQKEDESLKEEETEYSKADEECAQDSGEDQDDGNNDDGAAENKRASTPLIAMDSPDFMSKIAMRFKALDDELDETKSTAADKTKPKEDTETQVDHMTDTPIEENGNNDNQDSASAGDVSDEGGDEDVDALNTSVSSDTTAKPRINGRAETRPRAKAAAARKDKRKKRVTGGGTSTLYSTFKPPQLKNNKRQRRKR